LGIERFQPPCILTAVSKLIRVVAMLTLALYGLAALHCTLEGVPGFDFLKSCCFADSTPAVPPDCGDDGCGPVEDGSYRVEEQTTSAPQPPLILILQIPAFDALFSELEAVVSIAPESPPELPKFWQFSYRTALPPRAPSSLA